MELFKRHKIEQPTPSAENKTVGEQIDRTRRSLTLALVAAGTVVAEEAFAANVIKTVPVGLMAENKLSQPSYDAPTPEKLTFNEAKQRVVDYMISVTSQALKGKEVQDALHLTPKNYISTIFRNFDMPILAEHLYDTKYDVSELRQRYPHFLGIEKSKDSPAHARPVMVGPNDGHNRYDSYPKIEYGNAFYWNDAKTLVTVEHLAAMIPSAAGALRNDASDVSVADATNEFRAASEAQILHDDPSVTDEEIQGALVCVVGCDPDPMSDLDGMKVFPGVALKMTSEFTERAFGSVLKKEHPLMLEQMSRSFAFPLPSGMARGFPTEKNKAPACGMSGSPVFAFIRDKWRPAGIFFMASTIDDSERKQSHDIGHFMPISAIRETVANAKRWTLDRSQAS